MQTPHLVTRPRATSSMRFSVVKSRSRLWLRTVAGILATVHGLKLHGSSREDDGSIFRAKVEVAKGDIIWLQHVEPGSTSGSATTAKIRFGHGFSSGSTAVASSLSGPGSAPRVEDLEPPVCLTCPLCTEPSPLEYDWRLLARQSEQAKLEQEKTTEPIEQLYYMYNSDAVLRLPLRVSPGDGVVYFSVLNAAKMGGIGFGEFFPRGLAKKYLLYQIAIRWPAEHSFASCDSKKDCLELQLLHVAEDLSQSWVSFGFSPAVEPLRPSLLAQLTQINPSTGNRLHSDLAPELAENEELPIGTIDLEALFAPLRRDEKDTSAVGLTLHANGTSTAANRTSRIYAAQKSNETTTSGNYLEAINNSTAVEPAPPVKAGNKDKNAVEFVTYEDPGSGTAGTDNVAPFTPTRWFVRAKEVFPMKATVFEKIKAFIALHKADGNSRASVAPKPVLKSVVGSMSGPESGGNAVMFYEQTKSAEHKISKPPTVAKSSLASGSSSSTSPAMPSCVPAKLMPSAAARPLLAAVPRVAPISGKLQGVQDIFNRIEAENATKSKPGAAASEDEPPSSAAGTNTSAAAAVQLALPPKPEDITIDCTTCGARGIAYRHPNVISRSRTNRTAEDLAEHCKLVQSAQAVVKEKQNKALAIAVERARCRNLIDSRNYNPYAPYAQCKHAIQRLEKSYADASDELTKAQREKDRIKSAKAGNIAKAQDMLDAAKEAATGDDAKTVTEAPSEPGVVIPEEETSTTPAPAATTDGSMISNLMGAGADANEREYHPPEDPLVCPEIFLKPKKTNFGCALQNVDPFVMDSAMTCAGEVPSDANFRFGDPSADLVR
ncbi:unnamed protein product [Amoebophrya sp. A120]|nr:unnamed protein product [Amoebophrya sp. A120]|eukprot:GSA120T00005820001.1